MPAEVRLDFADHSASLESLEPPHDRGGDDAEHEPGYDRRPKLRRNDRLPGAFAHELDYTPPAGASRIEPAIARTVAFASSTLFGEVTPK